MNTRRISSFLLCILLVALMSPLAAAQGIELRLPDGSRWSGAVGDKVEVRYVERRNEVTRQGVITTAHDLYIQIRAEVAGSMRDVTIFKGDIRAIRTLDDQPAEAKQAEPRRDAPGREAPGRQAPRRDQPRQGGTPAPSEGPGVFVLPLTGMVGLELRHQEIEAMGRYADKYGPGQIIILEIESPGGAVVEMEQIADVLRDLKRRHRVVAWIREAISGGAATAAFCDEIYFASEGALGSMTMVSGGRSVPRERQLQWAQRAGEWFREGGRHPYFAHAMIVADAELSYDKDPETGRVTVYNNLSGEFELSRKGQNLTLNASNALHSGFSDGTADSVEDLARLLDLPEWREISDYGRRIHAQWVRNVDQATVEIQRAFRRYEYLHRGSGDQIQIIGGQIQQLQEVIRWIDRVPNIQMYRFPQIPERDRLERQIAELRKQLADLQRQRRGGRR